MYTNAPYYRLTLGKPPSRFRLAAHPPQIAVGLRVCLGQSTSRQCAGTNRDAIGKRAAAPAQG
eukprot:1516606-Prymnesium_polylepis.1